MAGRKLWVAEVYFDSKYYQGEGASTVGAPGTTAEVLMNRRLLQGTLTSEGQLKLTQAMNKIMFDHGLETKAKFDKHCGCRSCPCSPGYKLTTKTSYDGERSHDDFRIKIHITKEGEIKIINPKFTYWIKRIDEKNTYDREKNK